MAAELAEQLTEDMKGAMRSGDKVRLGAIRRARAALKNAEIEQGGPLDETASIAVLRKLARQHEESIEQFTAAGRDELVAKEQEELAMIEGYLPVPVDPEELERIVAEVISAEGASSMKDMGRVIGAATARLGAGADTREVAAVAKRLLAG